MERVVAMEHRLTGARASVGNVNSVKVPAECAVMVEAMMAEECPAECSGRVFLPLLVEMIQC